MNSNRAYVVARQTMLALILTACGATVGAAGEDDDTPEPGVVGTAQDGPTSRSEAAPPATEDDSAVVPDVANEDATTNDTEDADADAIESMPDAREDAATEEDAAAPVIDSGSAGVQAPPSDAEPPPPPVDAGQPIEDAGVDSGTDSGSADSGGPVDSGADACVPRSCKPGMCGTFVTCGITRNCGGCNPNLNLTCGGAGTNYCGNCIGDVNQPAFNCRAEKPRKFLCGNGSNYSYMNTACGAPVYSQGVNVWFCCP